MFETEHTNSGALSSDQNQIRVCLCCAAGSFVLVVTNFFGVLVRGTRAQGMCHVL